MRLSSSAWRTQIAFHFRKVFLYKKGTFSVAGGRSKTKTYATIKRSLLTTMSISRDLSSTVRFSQRSSASLTIRYEQMSKMEGRKMSDHLPATSLALPLAQLTSCGFVVLSVQAKLETRMKTGTISLMATNSPLNALCILRCCSCLTLASLRRSSSACFQRPTTLRITRTFSALRACFIIFSLSRSATRHSKRRLNLT
jgi:hypothetical protein